MICCCFKVSNCVCETPSMAWFIIPINIHICVSTTHTPTFNARHTPGMNQRLNAKSISKGIATHAIQSAVALLGRTANWDGASRVLVYLVSAWGLHWMRRPVETPMLNVCGIINEDSLKNATIYISNTWASPLNIFMALQTSSYSEIKPTTIFPPNQPPHLPFLHIPKNGACGIKASPTTVTHTPRLAQKKRINQVTPHWLSLQRWRITLHKG